MKDIIYTIAFDHPDQIWHQVMAKFLVSSIFRAGFSGDVLILTNSDHPVFQQRRDRVTEICLDTSAVLSGNLSLEAQKFKYNARHFFPRRRYGKVMFVDCDCIFSDSPHHVLAGTEDIGYAEEGFVTVDKCQFNAYLTDRELKEYANRNGINSGAFWVRAELFEEVMQEWASIDARPPVREKICGDQPAWVRLLLDTKLKTKASLGKEVVVYPFLEPLDARALERAKLLHFAGTSAAHKLPHLFGHYMRRFQAPAALSICSLLDG